MILLLTCSPPAPGDGVFARGGLILPDGAFVEQDWSPGEVVRGAVAPQQADCVVRFSVELGDVARLVAGGGVPDSDVAFSPEGRLVAAGGHTPHLVVVDRFTR